MTPTDQRRRALSLYTVGFTLLLAILACGGATADSVRILDVPQFICPTSTPQATHTQAPTQVQPDIQVPPSGYVTYTPVPGCIWNGSFCATNTPYPGGAYSTPGYSVPGPTSTPRPTLTPWPTPTPYIITGGFHLGADVYTGGFDSAVSVRLRIEEVTIYPVAANRQVVAWTVEIENIGSAPTSPSPADRSSWRVSRQQKVWWKGSGGPQRRRLPLPGSRCKPRCWTRWKSHREMTIA